MQDLCNGLRTDLTAYFRGKDKAHHKIIKSQCPHGSRGHLSLADMVEEAKGSYPRTDAVPHYSLVMAHTKPIGMNHTENARLAPEGASSLEPPEGGTLNNKPQKMKVWVGMKLLACVNMSDEYTRNGLE